MDINDAALSLPKGTFRDLYFEHGYLRFVGVVGWVLNESFRKPQFLFLIMMVAINTPCIYISPSSSALRLTNYFELKDDDDILDNDRIGPHTDYSGFTLLKADHIPGLEVSIFWKWCTI